VAHGQSPVETGGPKSDRDGGYRVGQRGVRLGDRDQAVAGQAADAGFVRGHGGDSDFLGLPITLQHAARVAELPDHHTDPFDRMLIAQAGLEGATIITRDSQFEAYDVPLLRT
jgi:hypothetical protein